MTTPAVPPPPRPSGHWLLNVVRRAGLTGADALRLDAGLPAPAAWEAAARTLGVPPHRLAELVAAHFRLSLADLGTAEPKARKLVPERVAREHRVFPLRETDRTIVVATSDPTDFAAEQELGFASGRRPVFEVAAPDEIAAAVESAYAPAQAIDALLTASGDAADAVALVADAEPEALAMADVEATPVVKLTGLILHEAVKAGASDVHIEPGRTEGAVRLRVDGVMRTRMTLPLPVVSRVVSRIKVLARLDIADRLRPQDGRARLSVEGRTVDLRVSTVPTRHSEKAVIRLLDAGRNITLAGLALPELDLARIRHLLSHRDGIVLVSGPTGSGKTTTLYAALRELADGQVNITTVEDPIEYELPGITQIQVDPRTGVTFASALRAILRQDPDVILVGEIRDAETAQIAVQASMTGHLVLATVHANDAASTVRRMLDLGVDAAGVAATLRGAIAQRLIRRTCAACGGTGASGSGETCAACGGSGYRGRLPVLEILTVTPPLQRAIGAGAPTDELARAAVAAGMRTLREAALRRASEGLTTSDEVERVLGRAAEDAPGSSPESSGPPGQAATAAPARVLVVDDDPLMRQLEVVLLEGAGYQAAEAGDGAQAIQMLGDDERFALVVMDMDMPNVNGRQALAAIRAAERTRALPVVMLTASEDAALESALMDEGADDYIRKPIKPDRFLARVKAVLRRRA